MTNTGMRVLELLKLWVSFYTHTHTDNHYIGENETYLANLLQAFRWPVPFQLQLDERVGACIRPTSGNYGSRVQIHKSAKAVAGGFMTRPSTNARSAIAEVV